MDEDNSNPLHRMSSRTRNVAPKMVAALASSDNRFQAAIARLEALENDNAGVETLKIEITTKQLLLTMTIKKRQSKGTKQKTLQAEALEARSVPRTFMVLLRKKEHLLPYKDLQDLLPGTSSAVFVDFLPTLRALDVA